MLGALILGIIVAAGIAYAGIVVIYPITGSVSEENPPVVFEEGSNSGSPGLNGGTVEVSIGDNGASAVLSLQATYQTTYVVNILKIANNDASNTYYVKVAVVSPIAADEVSEAKMLIDIDGDGTVDTSLDLTSTVSPVTFTLPAGSTATVSFKFVIAEDQSFTGTLNFELSLYYSPETPIPAPPS